MSSLYMILSLFFIVNCLATANGVTVSAESNAAVSTSTDDDGVAVSAESHSAASASTDNDGVAVSAESHSAASASTYNEDGQSLENCGSLEPQTCTDPNEEFVQEKSSCPPDTCNALVARIDCRNAPPPQPGCVCKSGYRRLDKTMVCVPLCECPEMAYAPACEKKTCKDPNEEFVQEKPCCPPDTCESLVAKYDCSKSAPPQPGCVCKSGYKRLNETSKCVPLCECPQMASSPDCQPQTCKDPNEEFVQEKPCCPPDTCESLVAKYDCSKSPPPQPGCVCKSGYKRLNETSKCVPLCECPQMASSPDCQPQTCKDPNEEFVQEKPCCPPDTCESLVAKYDCSKSPPPQPGCVCKSGYKRLNETSKCVPICQCPQLASSPDCQPQTCKDPNEEFVQEKPCCPPDTCESLVAKYDCSKSPPPQPGCVCKSGYKRLNETSKCVPLCECPQLASSPDCQPQTCKDPNEEYVKEKPSCPPDTCNALVARYNCTNAPPPQPGCVCKSGYRRLNEISGCVPICECPEMASSPDCPKQTCEDPNEEFVQKKKTCPPDTCISIVARYDCSKSPPPQPGCVCKSGYKRLNETSKCVPICQCPQLASSPDCQPQTCKDPNEEFVQEKPSCPPDTCKALVARYDCTKAPPPQPGCVCKSGYRRLNETSGCVPTCKCPQMASSAQCQQKPKPVLRCGANEIRRCVKKCPPEKTCRNRNIKVACPLSLQPCKEKCVCAPGYYRNYLGTCITEKQCDMCNKKNEFYDCGSACDNECINIDKQNRTNCPIVNKVCNKKCYCDDGYARDESGNCIPVSQCNCQPQTCKDPNEEFVQEKPNCPPDTCNALVARYNCTNAPPPQPGCVCKSGYRRLDETSCCVPICECPEMASSAQCQQKPKPVLRCGTNEIRSCVKKCPPERTCRNRFIQVACLLDLQPCTEKCVCAPGYYRNYLGTCITEKQCDMCNKKNEFYDCGSACDNECINIDKQNRTNCPIVNIVCNKKCYCEDGYARDESGNCIPVSQCKKPRDPNEEYICTRSCPPDHCIATVALFKCDGNEVPKLQYRCKPGFFREVEGGPCKPKCQCPQMRNSPDCQT
ncbi:unnamed protein product [Chilo suppressalis]|uniref:EGF-like domain-containing protein n=1 Tax=Chilo suppressalis TaxID=168631 RepID=A0ABN8LBI1_CHISP|nr:unnamed protein product [Chilo suppressalis]